MKELIDLDDFDRAVLLASCDANNWSLKSHVPIEAIVRILRGVNVKRIKKTIKMLVSSGFIKKHPTKNQMTYELTKNGLISGNQLKRE